MAYTKQTWEDEPLSRTPITAARLGHMETQYDEAVATLAGANAQGNDVYGRFGPTAQAIDNTDLNNLVRSGQYRGNLLTNSPNSGAGSYFFIEVMGFSNDFVAQRATGLNSASGALGAVFTRSRENGVWGPWKRIYTLPGSATLIPESDLSASAQQRIGLGADTYDRFGPKAKQLANGYDLDGLWQGGQYRAVAPANAPIVVAGEWWYIEVISHEPGYIVQRATGMTGYYQGIAYTRVQSGGGWSSWKLTGGGDTGTRSINAAMTNVVTDGNSACTIRRVNNIVTLKLINFRRAPGQLAPEPVYTVPAGFRSPTEETGSGVNEGGTGSIIGAFVYNGGRIRLFNLPDAETYNKVSMTWLTDEAWPSTLP